MVNDGALGEAGEVRGGLTVVAVEGEVACAHRIEDEDEDVGFGRGLLR